MVTRKRAGWGLAFLLVLAAAACSSSGGTDAATPTGTSTGQGTVGPAGGQVATSDGVLTVSVPTGALQGDTHITITEIASPAPGAIGKTYDIGPSGTQFSVPVTLTFKYGGFDLMGNAPTSLEVATIVSGEWIALAGEAVDPGAQVATAQTPHLSQYGVHVKGNGHDSGASTDAATSEDASTSGDGGLDAGVKDSGFDASGCTPVFQQVGSCANHPVQICSGGKVFTGCADLTPMGYSASCCPPGA